MGVLKGAVSPRRCHSAFHLLKALEVEAKSVIRIREVTSLIINIWLAEELHTDERARVQQDHWYGARNVSLHRGLRDPRQQAL